MRDRQLIENLLQLDRLLLRPNHTTEQANDSNKTHQLRPGQREGRSLIRRNVVMVRDIKRINTLDPFVGSEAILEV